MRSDKFKPYLSELLWIHDPIVGEVKAQLIGEHYRSLLVHVVTQDTPGSKTRRKVE